MKLYKLSIIYGPMMLDEGDVSEVFCGIFDSKDKAEACLESIRQTEQYEWASCTFGYNDVFEDRIEEIEINKNYWQ